VGDRETPAPKRRAVVNITSVEVRFLPVRPVGTRRSNRVKTAIVFSRRPGKRATDEDVDEADYAGFGGEVKGLYGLNPHETRRYRRGL